MSFDVGDIIQLDFGKEYVIIGTCEIDNLEYYFAMDKADIQKTIIFEKEKSSDTFVTVREKEKIEEVLKIISDMEN